MLVNVIQTNFANVKSKPYQSKIDCAARWAHYAIFLFFQIVWKNVNGPRSAILAARNLKKVLNAKLRTDLVGYGWENYSPR